MIEISFGEHWWQFVLIAIACYLFGSINFAWLIARKKHNKDITKLGSGNPGTMNMTREFGWKAGLATFLCDALKGGLPVLAMHLLYKDCVFIVTGLRVSDCLRYFSAVFVVIGHIFPATMSFRGGKGIASTLGAYWFALSCENLWWILLGFVIAVIIISFIYYTEWGSMGSLLGVSMCSIIQAIYFVFRYAGTPVHAHGIWIFGSLLALNFLTWCAHYKNVTRLFAGEEHRTSFKKIIKKKA
ncbi:MAG: glycerol-3-phosphate acyltransferase [Clostridia bacterium]|nr:glycerol-3-phosphate acyltransferase [Clostridia bacterium]